MFALSNILAGQGRDAECEYVLKRILEQDPRYLPAYSDLAELYLRANRAGDAADVIASGLQHAPGDPVLLNNNGMCQFLLGNYAGAAESFAAAVAAAPNDPSLRANHAAALGMLGREDDARQIYQQIMDPRDVRHNMSVLRNAEKQLAAGMTPAPVDLASEGGDAPPASH